jgi:hypothetical protein
MAVSLVALVGYLGFIGFEGSQAFGAHDRSGDCRTPESAFGWAYEAINYDIADDAALKDRADCPVPASRRGSRSAPPTASDRGLVHPRRQPGRYRSTIVLTHGNGSSKARCSAGQSPPRCVQPRPFDSETRVSSNSTTLGACGCSTSSRLDWPAHRRPPVAVLGVSMGGVAIDEATTDDRVAAIGMDSTRHPRSF